MMRYYFIPVRMTIIKKTNAIEAVEKREPFYTVGGNADYYSYYGEKYEGSSKDLK